MSCPLIPARRREGNGKPLRVAGRPPPCFPLAGRMCYNHRAVEDGAKRGVVPVSMEPVEPVSGKAAQEKPSRSMGIGNEDASRYCPICSQRLESRRCKLICGACGYYMSCADFY
jgi:hypothetical protein